MVGITFEEHLAKLPKEEQEAIKRESTRLSAECFLMHDEDVARDFIKHLSKSRQEEIIQAAAQLKAKREARAAKRKSKAVARATSDSVADAPISLSAKGK
ncbi:MAG: hypothetical protein MJE68_29015 [Proteobacteria bacterium]|nr:hypothetical protein [Pseudomonadota bacterium]